MRVRDFLFEVITFGGYSRRVLARLSKTIADDAKGASKAVKSAARAKVAYEAKPPQMVVIVPPESNDPAYPRALKELVNDAHYKWLMYSVEQDIFQMLNNATDDKAVEIMGMAKGFQYLRSATYTIIERYEKFLNASEEDEDFERDVV